MRRTYLMIMTLCLPLVLCGPAKAQHSGPYVGAFVGGNALVTAKGSDSDGSFSLKFDPALQGSAVLGWDFAPRNPVGEGRIELEYTRRSNPLKQVKFAEGDINGSGKVTADSLLLNFFAMYRDKSPWSPYAGVGAGVARMEASDLKVAGNPLGHGTSVVFAYQLGAGIDFAMNKYLSLDLGYRFFNSIRPKFTEANGQTFKMDYYSHNAILGLRVGF
jgi:opacity protein-like surface antigen